MTLLKRKPRNQALAKARAQAKVNRKAEAAKRAMQAGDKVLVYPHGSPGQAATGEVVAICDGRSIAVGFKQQVPFSPAPIQPGRGLLLLASRAELNGKAWGPWVEAFNGGHYEIEPLPVTAEPAWAWRVMTELPAEPLTEIKPL